MAEIVPTITAENPHVFREQIERVDEFSKRIHVDLMDGVFAPSKSVLPEQVWWPEGTIADVHVMHQEPEETLEALIKLKPRLIILQAESSFDVHKCAERLRAAGIQYGISLLAATAVSEVAELVAATDHLLIFSGNLGYQGGSTADLELLKKVAEAKAINPKLEIGWDGGVNAENAAKIAQAGVDVINVGGSIHAAENPALAYRALSALIA